MSDLSDEARALLTRVKGEKAVSAEALARVRSKVLRRASVSAAVGAVGTALATKTAAAPSAPAGAAWLFAAKTVGGLAVIGAITAGGVALERRAERTSAPGAESPVAPVATVLPPTRKPDPNGTASPRLDPAPESVVAESVAPVASSPPAAPRRAPTTPAAPPDTATEKHEERPSRDDYVPPWAADLALLRDAQAALLAGDPQRARALAERVGRGGAFDDEREALLAVAECRAGGDEASHSAAQRRADAFVRSHAGSSLADRVQTACIAGRPSIP